MRIALVILLLLALITGVYGENIDVGGGIYVSNFDGSTQGNLLVDKRGATFEAGSTDIIDKFRKDIQLDFDDGYKLDSKVGIEEGFIGICSETTKRSEVGAETTASLAAKGSIVVSALSGAVGSNFAGQEAAMANGLMASSLGMSIADNSIISVQKTKIDGEMAQIGSYASCNENIVQVDGYGAVPYDLNSDLQALAKDHAIIRGEISSGGSKDKTEYLSANSIDFVSSNEGTGFGRALDVVNLKDGSTSTFVAQATNAKNTLPGHTELYIPPDNARSPNEAYKYLGTKWYESDTTNPNIQFSLSLDSQTFLQKGIDRNQFKTAVSNALTTWDDAVTYTDLFRPLGDTTATPGSRWQWVPPGLSGDGINCIGWQNLGGSSNGYITLAQTEWWTDQFSLLGYGYLSKGILKEADISFNSDQAVTWSILPHDTTIPSWSNVNDVETTALHEMGHAIGLAHPYYSVQKYWWNPFDLADKADDLSEIMVQDGFKSWDGSKQVTLHRNNKVQHYLGAGDTLGVRLLYPGRGDSNNNGQVDLNEALDTIDEWASGREPLSYPIYYINIWSKT